MTAPDDTATHPPTPDAIKQQLRALNARSSEWRRQARHCHNAWRSMIATQDALDADLAQMREAIVAVRDAADAADHPDAELWDAVLDAFDAMGDGARSWVMDPDDTDQPAPAIDDYANELDHLQKTWQDAITGW